VIDSISMFYSSVYFGIILYWIPLLFCFIGYSHRTYINYKNDLRDRELFEKEESRYYKPTDTIGSLVGRGIATVVPVLNLFSALFDVGPMIFDKLFKWISNVFDTPLVPKKSK